VTTRRDGVRIHYRLAGDDIAALYALLRQVAQTHQAAVEVARTAYLGSAVHGADAEEVGREELLARAQAGDVVVVDVRPVEEYVAGHIPGAVSVPVEDLTERLAELPAGTEVVAYCRGTYCVLAYDAARLLHARGRRAVRLAGWLAG